ncbi:abscisic acid-deficient protein Aba4 family protein [Moorena sp. SIO3A2]
MVITQLFNIANIFVLPFWLLIIFLPNWGITRTPKAESSASLERI